MPRLEKVPMALGGLLMALTAGAIAFDVVSRNAGLGLLGGSAVAGIAFALLALRGLHTLFPPAHGLRGHARFLVSGFAAATLLWGLLVAAQSVGGTEPVLGIPLAVRFVGAAVVGALVLSAPFVAAGPGALSLAAGAALAFALPPLPLVFGAAMLALALAVRVPVALALIAAVAVAPGTLSDAALAQTVLRGLSPQVLLAVPLFLLAAALMVAGGIGGGIVSAALWLARQRRTAAAEANVIASMLFGGVSGSGLADAALGARLIAPAMVARGHSQADAAALTAAAAILPNLLPPSIALLLAAAATDQSVGALWTAGLGAGVAAAVALWVAVRLRGEGAPAEPTARPDLSAIVPPLLIAVGVIGGLRAGLVTATEAGVVAVALAGAYAIRRRGLSAVLAAFAEAGGQAGRIALLIGAAAPVGFILATRGLDPAALLPAAAPLVSLAVAAGLCLLAGTVLDIGAAILLLLPLLVPPLALSGVDPVQAAVALTLACLVGGLTPPVGLLVLSVKEVTGARGVYRAAVPYLAALLAALAFVVAAPWLTAGLAAI